MFEFRRGGRKVTAKEMLSGLMEDAVELALSEAMDEFHTRAAAVVDPETGKHPAVFVRRTGPETFVVSTSGSPTFARALEERLDLSPGEVRHMSEPADRPRLVYLAHATEDKELVLPIAQGLMKRGIRVWYDDWEIGYGDSLRRKMEQGLGECTHFVVLLTPTSIEKPWVQEEVDAGLVAAVGGTAHFIALRHELPVSALSPFLRTRHSPTFLPGDESLDELAGAIYGVSKKPPLGDKPRYVQEHQHGSSWSASARAVAEYFVRGSQQAHIMDPQSSYTQIQEETGLPMMDVRIGVLDLAGSGLLERREFWGGDSTIWPKPELFVTFDADFMPWNPAEDARSLAEALFNLEATRADAEPVAIALGWEPRRFNSAAAYLVGAKVVQPVEYMGAGNYWPPSFRLGDELMRFVRSV
ncbi:toll/interleukin-1 receptor domain-containing protein [Ancylobacter sp.]|uniref:toll/interleukin-1 receptor domain-containing protein n=1 Tax=Ancylobacter sp. TaxID=1872567 RepID=UPI003D10F3CB